MTGFPVAVLPGKPGKPEVHPGSITAVIMWENGDSGNVPFEKFEIQSLTDGKQFVVVFITKHRSASKYCNGFKSRQEMLSLILLSCTVHMIH